MLFGLCCITFVAANVLGGATHSGYLGDPAIQLISVPLLIGSLWPALSARDPNRHMARLTLALSCAIALLALFQAVPLPLDVWHGGAPLLTWPLPAAEPMPAPWTSLSLTPEATWTAALSFIVPLSIFGAVTQLPLRQRATLSWMLVALGGLSLILGFAQVAQGPESVLRFFDVTNPNEAVGLFANRNHFAAHLYVTLVLAAVWFQIVADRALQRRKLGTHTTLLFAAAAVFLVAIVAGLAFSRSRAGIFLAMAALFGIVLSAYKHGSGAASVPPRRRGRGATLAVLGFAAVFAALFGLGGTLARFQTDRGPDIRSALSRTTFETALTALPFGTGLGSFVPVYAAAEKSQDIFDGYANRAHNDLAELFLETGVLGIALLSVFLAWFAQRSYKVWIGPQSDVHPLQALLERAATLIVALLLAHSLVDYPLRTTALSAIFAFCCGMLAAPASEPRAINRERRRERGDRILQLQEESAPAQGERWDAGIQWPHEWQK